VPTSRVPCEAGFARLGCHRHPAEVPEYLDPVVVVCLVFIKSKMKMREVLGPNVADVHGNKALLHAYLL
jgi:hypothetical protein